MRVLTIQTPSSTYLDNYRQIWDLYINNATCEPTEISTKTADDSTAEFVTEEAVFYQNGTWEYNNIADIGDENLAFCQSTSELRARRTRASAQEQRTTGV